MIRYLASTLSGKGPEAMENMLSSGIELATSCILGLREGDLVLIEENHSRNLITDPSKPGYEQNWKEILKEKIPGLLLMLGNHLVKTSRSEMEVREKN